MSNFRPPVVDRTSHLASNADTTFSPTPNSFMHPWKPLYSPPRFPLHLEQAYKMQDSASSLPNPPESQPEEEVGENQPQVMGIKDTEANTMEEPKPTSSAQFESLGARQAFANKDPSPDCHRPRSNNPIGSYVLPRDMVEHERLSIQHRVITHFLGSLYPAAAIVEEILASDNCRTAMILDIGTGSGAWAIEMAAKFPMAKVIGMDLAPPHLGSITVPENCRFDIEDANLPFPYRANMFDIVHVRALGHGISDLKAFLHSVARIIRPGGLLIVGNGSSRFVDDHGELCSIEEGREGFRWLQKIYSAIHTALNNRPSGQYIQECRPLLLSSPFYKDITSQILLLPIGNWASPAISPEYQYAAGLNQQNFFNVVEAFTPFLLSNGYRQDVVQYWRSEVIKELSELKDRTFAPVTWTWCRRSDIPWTPVAGNLKR